MGFTLGLTTVFAGRLCAGFATPASAQTRMRPVKPFHPTPGRVRTVKQLKRGRLFEALDLCLEDDFTLRARRMN